MLLNIILKYMLDVKLKMTFILFSFFLKKNQTEIRLEGFEI